MIDDGYTLYLQLQKLNLLENKPPLWWPNPYTIEMLVGAILTQNTKWTRVVTSLENLKNNNILSLNALAKADNTLVVECIRTSGFFNAKSQNIQRLSQAILDDFGDFEIFQESVSREWLLSQKGIGQESADAILCYGCGSEVMVVDKYTQQLVLALGLEFDDYEDLQAWCMQGFLSDQAHQDFALFHGMIVEYMKKYKKGKVINTDPILR